MESVSKTSDESAAAVVLAREAVDVTAACQRVAALPITNQAELDALGAGVKSVKARLKEIETWRKSHTDPLLAEVEGFREQSRPAESAYRALEGAIKARMLRYRTEAAAAETAARLRAQTVQAEAHVAASVGALPRAAELQTQAFQVMQSAAPAMTTAGVSTVKTWAIKVTRPELVPERFKVVDESAVLAYVREKLGKASEYLGSIPEDVVDGVALYVSESIRA